MKKIVLGLGLLLAAGSAMPLSAANGLEALRGLELGYAKLPIYNNQTLQLMAFCDRAERNGKLMVGTNTVLDIIRRGADVDAIRDGWGVSLYPLEAPLPEVMKFWKDRLYSEGIITTPRADIDQETRIAAGNDRVFFRSPTLDLDGLGFESDFDKRTVLVKSDVKILLRMGSSDPRKLFAPGAKLPEKYEYLTATSDSMLIDLVNNQIILIGDVKINEARSGIDCDRMTIFLDRKSDDELRRQNAGGELAMADSLEGVSRIFCDGDVKIYRKLTPEELAATGEQKALADHMVYDVVTGSVTLTGEKRDPQIFRGRESLAGKRIVLFRDEQRATVDGECRVVVVQPPKTPAEAENVMAVRSDRAVMNYKENNGEFIGNVKVDDPRMELNCDRMLITMRELPGSGGEEAADGSLTGLPEFGAGGKRELDQIRCSGGVKVTRKDAEGKLIGNERAVSRDADFNYALKRITLSGDRPTLTRGDSSMSGTELEIWINEERLVVKDDSRIVFTSAPVEAAAGKQSETVITSDSSDLNYKGNKLIFTGNVQVRDQAMKLDCDRMELVLADRKRTDQRDREVEDLEQQLAGDMESGNKTLVEIICTGNVHATEPRADLTTDKLVLSFQEVPEGTAAMPGMFQSNGTRLTRIFGDGKLVMVSQPQTDGAAADSNQGGLLGALGGGSQSARTIKADRGTIDLLKNTADFHGSVQVQDAEGTLDCQDMYLFARDKKAAKNTSTAKSGKKPAAVDPDADPLAIAANTIGDEAGGQDLVPDQIALGDDLELARILCKQDVLLVRHTDKGDQCAGGEVADYDVAMQQITLTGTKEKQPWMQEVGKAKMSGDRILVGLKDGSMKVDGRTQVTFPGLR